MHAPKSTLHTIRCCNFVFFTAIGTVPSPFDCYMVNRGVKTLHLRMKEHQKNGLAVARELENNPRVEKVVHPGINANIFISSLSVYSSAASDNKFMLVKVHYTDIGVKSVTWVV